MKTICNIYHNRVEYEGCVYRMNKHPLVELDGFFEKIEVLKKKYACNWVSYNINGYKCLWEIKNQCLFLLKVELIACTLDENNKAVPEYTKELCLQELFDTTLSKISADWFSDKLEVILFDSCIATHASGHALYKKESLYLRFVEGRAIKRSSVQTDVYPCKLIEEEKNHASLF